MLHTPQNALQENNIPLEPDTPKQNHQRIFIEYYSAKEIKKALVPLHGGNCPVEELIAVGEAVFQFINSSEMEWHLKSAFGHLEKLFDFCKNLIESGKYHIILVKKV